MSLKKLRLQKKLGILFCDGTIPTGSLAAVAWRDAAVAAGGVGGSWQRWRQLEGSRAAAAAWRRRSGSGSLAAVEANCTTTNNRNKACRLVQLIPMCSKWEPNQNVSQIFERNGPREKTRENKFRCTDVYRRSGECVLLGLSGNRKDLKCVVRGPWSIVGGLWSVVCVN